jgi:hypothetical protein
MVLGLDKRTLKKVNKILRGFLWARRTDANGSHCLVNWSRSVGRLGWVVWESPTWHAPRSV